VNLKVANLVAVQLGIFVGIMSWLVYSRFPSAEPRAAAKMQKPTATLAPAFEPGDQRPQTVDYRVDREVAQPVIEQPAPALHQYSEAAVQQFSALAAKQYYQQIAPRRYVTSSPENKSVAADSVSYAAMAQEPVVVPADYGESPQPVAYVEPAQVVVYSQPAPFVVFSNPRRFARRCQPTRPPGLFAPVTHRRPGRAPCNVSGGVLPRQKPSVPPCRPTQSFKHRGHR
jgi:hypothetical protein